MISKYPTLIAAGLLLSLLSACSQPGQPESRETSGYNGGNNESGIGIGGTGAIAKGDYSTIGIGGTGIIGTITGKGSILVNGVRLSLNALSPASPQGQQSYDANLAVGDVIIATARPTRVIGNYAAQSVSKFVPIAGRLEAIASDQKRLVIMDTQIEIARDTIIVAADGANQNMKSLRLGDYLEVSGLWNSGRVIASRIVSQPASHDLANKISGTVSVLSDGKLAVGSTQFKLLAEIEDLREGRFITLSGKQNDSGVFVATEAVRSPTAFGSDVNRIIVESYVEQIDNSQRLSGFGISIASTNDNRSIDNTVVAVASAVSAPDLVVASRPDKQVAQNVSTASGKVAQKAWSVDYQISLSPNRSARADKLRGLKHSHVKSTNKPGRKNQMSIGRKSAPSSQHNASSGKEKAGRNGKGGSSGGSSGGSGGGGGGGGSSGGGGGGGGR